MKLDWLRKMAVATRPRDLVTTLEGLAGTLAGGEASYLDYDWDNWCLRRNGEKVAMDNESLAGKCALAGEAQQSDGSLALPVRRFGSLMGILVVNGGNGEIPRAELEELGEGFALMSDTLEELDHARQALSQFQDLQVTAVEGLPEEYSGHVTSVCQLTADLAEYLDLSAQARRRLWSAALYHDVGKLLMQGRSKPEVDRGHAEEGAKFLSNSGTYASLADLVRHHHELYDGSGFPQGLRGDQLSVEHWVLVLAEAFEDFLALNPHLGFEAKIGIFFKEKGRGHHPDVLDALAGLIDSGRLDRLR